MTTITAHNLGRVIDQVTRHQATDDTLGALCGIHFDATTDAFHAVATDRYTVAVARAESHHARDPWAHTLPGTAVPILRGWLATLGGGDLVQVLPEVDGTTHLLFEALGGTLAFDVADGVFPDWRTLFAKHLPKQPVGEFTGFNSQMLARWQTGEELLHCWQSGPRSPLILAGDNFLGMQMPVYREDLAEKTAEIRASWRSMLRRRTAYVLGVAYRLDALYRDRGGDAWEYTGRDRDGEPLMHLPDLEDAGALPLAEVIKAYGPLTPVADKASEQVAA